MMITHASVFLHGLAPQINFSSSAAMNEQIVLRWIHLVAGFIWIGLLYFFNLVGFPMMKQLDASVRGKIYPLLMERAMWWFRWSALITVLVGLRYFAIILSDDARNAGNPSLTVHWFGWWTLVWLAAYALIYPFQIPSSGILNNPWVRAIAIAIIVVAASWVVLDLASGAQSSNAHQAIGVGGGIGLLMLLNTWGVVWRAQKRLIAWTRASAADGTPMPTEAERLARWSFLASRVGFWLSFPMLFFMGAAEHYPFLIGLAG